MNGVDINRAIKHGQIMKDTIRRTVLVVDDDQMNLVLISDMLYVLGHDSIVVESGESAIRVMTESTESIDVAVIDFRMPRMNGIQAFRELRKINPRIKAILYSSDAVENCSECDLIDGLDYLEKTFELDSFEKAIRQIV